MSAINFPIIVVRKFSTNAVVLSPALTSDNLPLLPDYDWAFRKVRRGVQSAFH